MTSRLRGEFTVWNRYAAWIYGLAIAATVPDAPAKDQQRQRHASDLSRIETDLLDAQRQRATRRLTHHISFRKSIPSRSRTVKSHTVHSAGACPQTTSVRSGA